MSPSVSCHATRHLLHYKLPISIQIAMKAQCRHTCPWKRDGQDKMLARFSLMLEYQRVVPGASTILRCRMCYRPGKVQRIGRPVLHDDVAPPHLAVRFIADIELLHATVEAIEAALRSRQ